MAGAGTSTVALPGGRWLAGERHREAELRLPGGVEAARLADELTGLGPAKWTTALLARSLARLGPSGEVSADVVRSLTVGDREALLLHLCRHWVGERLECVVRCPRCGEWLDVEVGVADLLVDPYEEAAERHEATVEEGGEEWTVRFRLPTGADQEAAIGASPQEAARLLLESCVDGVWRDGERLEAIPSAVVEEAGALMSRLDPQAELMLRLDCAACEEPFRACLDAGAFLAHAVTSRRAELEREVHVLALHYHWSEAEILAMNSRRRGRYLELLAQPAGAEALA
jgi:hypothetical protein